MIPQDCDLKYEESFNSFLAGLLLTRNHVNNFTFFHLLNSFQNRYNVTVVSLGNDINVPIYLNDDEITLHMSLDDEILVNGKSISVRSYLYSFTTPRIREFFKIDNLKESKKSLLVKKMFRNKIAI